MEQRVVMRYSMAFKQQVVRDLESGRFVSILAAQEHYGICGNGTIQDWLKRYGKQHLCARVIKVETPDEKDQMRQLKQRIKQLEQALGRTQAENVLNQEFLKLACDGLGQEVEVFKKKVGTRLCMPPKNAPGKP